MCWKSKKSPKTSTKVWFLLFIVSILMGILVGNILVNILHYISKLNLYDIISFFHSNYYSIYTILYAF